jgi:hypothetical protein
MGMMLKCNFEHACRISAMSFNNSADCRDFFNQRDALVYARNALMAGKSSQDVADGLVDRALKRYTADNVAVIVVKFPWAFKS